MAQQVSMSLGLMTGAPPQGCTWQKRRTSPQSPLTYRHAPKCTPHKNKYTWGWRDGSAVKNTDCSSRGPEFKSQKPHDCSQPSVTRSDI